MELFVLLFPEIIQTKAKFSKDKILESVIAFRSTNFERFMEERFLEEKQYKLSQNMSENANASNDLYSEEEYNIHAGGKKHTHKVKKTKHNSSKRTKHRKIFICDVLFFYIFSFFSKN